MHGSLHLIYATEADRSRRAAGERARLASTLRRPFGSAAVAARAPRRCCARHPAARRPGWRRNPPRPLTLPAVLLSGARLPRPGAALRCSPNAARSAASVSGSAGKNDSIASSATVTSIAVPNVASALNSRSSDPERAQPQRRDQQLGRLDRRPRPGT